MILMEIVPEAQGVNLWEGESKMAASVNGSTRVEILDTGDHVKYDIEIITDTGHMVILEYVLKWENTETDG